MNCLVANILGMLSDRKEMEPLIFKMQSKMRISDQRISKPMPIPYP